MARGIALAAVAAASLLAVSGAGGAPEQTPKRGGTLVLRMIGFEPACLNLVLERCHIGPTLLAVGETVLQRPFELAPDYSYRPALVSTVSYTKRPPFTLTYRIRPDARWSDGVPITARDFLFTLRALRKYGSARDKTFHRVVRSARAVDEKTLRVVLRPRIGGWRNLFGSVLPSHALRGEDLAKVWTDQIDNPKTGEAIGSGPYLVERWERGRQITLRRNAGYWGRHPAYLDRLVVKFAPAATDPTAALDSGEFDIATGVPPEYVSALRQKRGVRVAAITGGAFEHFDFRIGSGGHPALRSKLVRRALAYGIDRVTLVRQVYAGVDTTLEPLDSAILLSQDRFYEPNWRRYRYRPALARRLLGQAGCSRGADAIYTCDGARFALRFVTSAGVPTRARALTLVQAQLRQIGVEVETVFAPPRAFIDQILPNRAFDVALFTWVYIPGGSWTDVFGCGGAQNFAGYCQRLVSADLDQAQRILDEGQRARVLNRVDRQLARDVPTLPLYQFVLTVAYHANVRNFVMSSANVLWNAEDWWLAE